MRRSAGGGLPGPGHPEPGAAMGEACEEETSFAGMNEREVEDELGLILSWVGLAGPPVCISAKLTSNSRRPKKPKGAFGEFVGHLPLRKL